MSACENRAVYGQLRDISIEKIKISERGQTILKTLVERYISDGQPVGSKALAQASGLDLSAATIRNVLSDLEEAGLIASPHTSAGRIPTDLGYRLFVDRLVNIAPVQANTIQRLKQELSLEAKPDQLIDAANNILSELTSMTSVVMIPRQQQKKVQHIEFMPLSEKRVLAILVLSNVEVENRILHTQREFSKDELQKVANYLNDLIKGKPLEEVRSLLMSELAELKQQVSDFMSEVVDLADHIFPAGQQEQLLIAGEGNLLKYDEMSDMDTLRQMFDAFKHKKNILELLDRCLNAQNMQIFIGAESGQHLLQSCSVITTPYAVEGEVIGVLGVIGPTRIAYEKVIPTVDITAKLLSKALQFK